MELPWASVCTLVSEIPNTIRGSDLTSIAQTRFHKSKFFSQPPPVEKMLIFKLHEPLLSDDYQKLCSQLLQFSNCPLKTWALSGLLRHEFLCHLLTTKCFGSLLHIHTRWTRNPLSHRSPKTLRPNLTNKMAGRVAIRHEESITLYVRLWESNSSPLHKVLWQAESLPPTFLQKITRTMLLNTERTTSDRRNKVKYLLRWNPTHFKDQVDRGIGKLGGGCDIHNDRPTL
ncbi:hypothetical protein E1B28_002280 [Marasmius oreades]|uniref:Uncharacterized protein n=1 Tax=Marasmius oreades TaxID=181124 RepID=A0A9P7RNB6_9AGAR|nr:uncharacterized protein E1B28_002280 [Marasmius oreades]KAG7086316.1 hypothetical protein E1B28_002280 [Marasmius oreades]